MKRQHLVGVFFIFAAFYVSSAAVVSEGVASSTSGTLPSDVLQAFASSPSSRQYVFVSHIKPSYLQADFNGDRKVDAAVLVKHEATGKVGIAIIHGGSGTVTILGAGRQFGNGGDNFSWMDEWRIYPKGTVQQGVGENAPPALKGDGILIVKTMSASALIYWTGREYGWYQQAD